MYYMYCTILTTDFNTVCMTYQFFVRTLHKKLPTEGNINLVLLNGGFRYSDLMGNSGEAQAVV